jgi:NAD(P)-dependent dehydrogenase (short-subunit alcohol dehydrogenase family)
MRNEFANTVVMVAGGTGGLGRAVTLAFLNQGATVVVSYLSPGEWEQIQMVAGDMRSRLEGFHVDVTDESAVRALVDGILAKYKKLDAVVNTVGGYAGGVKLWDLDPQVWDKMFALNLRSGFALSRAVVPAMLKQHSGSIVNVASKAAFDHGSGAAAYVASKAAAVAMIDSLAADLAGTGVRANSILPSIIDTEANRRAMPAADFSKWPKPEQIAEVILFLCSPAAKAIHGAAIPVYGNS